tara:strand:+ start:810 stop:1463 length:654 start_codon:yes stop_codon:yes gene_type:complete
MKTVLVSVQSIHLLTGLTRYIFPLVIVIQQGQPARNRIEITPALKIEGQDGYHLIPYSKGPQWEVTDAVQQKKVLRAKCGQWSHLKDYLRLWKRFAKEKQLPISSYIVVSALLGSLPTPEDCTSPSANPTHLHLDRLQVQANSFYKQIDKKNVNDLACNGKNLIVHISPEHRNRLLRELKKIREKLESNSSLPPQQIPSKVKEIFCIRNPKKNATSM